MTYALEVRCSIQLSYRSIMTSLLLITVSKERLLIAVFILFSWSLFHLLNRNFLSLVDLLKVVLFDVLIQCTTL